MIVLLYYSSVCNFIRKLKTLMVLSLFQRKMQNFLWFGFTGEEINVKGLFLSSKTIFFSENLGSDAFNLQQDMLLCMEVTQQPGMILQLRKDIQEMKKKLLTLIIFLKLLKKLIRLLKKKQNWLILKKIYKILFRGYLLQVLVKEQWCLYSMD